MAEFEISTMDELVNAEQITGISTGDTLKLMNDIDGVESGYVYPTTLSNKYNIDLNGFTLKNLFLDTAGPFNNSTVVKNGKTLNIYFSTQTTSPWLNLENCVGSFYSNLSRLLISRLYKSAVDITYNPNVAINDGIFRNVNMEEKKQLSNIVIRNAQIRGTYFDNKSIIYPTPQGSFAAVVYNNCQFKFNKSSPRFYFYGDNCYAAFLETSFDLGENNTLSFYSSSNTQNLVSFPDGTFSESITLNNESPAKVKILTKDQLRSHEYLTNIGFLP